MELKFCEQKFFRVKRGQTLREIAAAFSVPPRLLASANQLSGPPQEGQVLIIPGQKGNLYRVRGGESKSSLCGSPERFEQRNATRCLYPGQIVLL